MPEKQGAGVRITRLEAENVKRLRAVTVTPDGALVVVGGRNAAGKSSTLDSIAYALGGAKLCPDEPIREGQDTATIKVALDNGLVIKRTFRRGADKITSKLEIVNARCGAAYKRPQAMLDALVGPLSFDPMAFKGMDAAKQADTLRKLVGLDLSKYDAERDRLYAERKQANAELKRIQGAHDSVPHHEGVPAEVVSVAALAGKLEAAADIARDHEAVDRTRAEIREEIEKCVAEIVRCDSEIMSLQQQIEDTRVARDTADGKLTATAVQDKELPPIPDMAAIRQEIADAEAVNIKIRENAARESLAADLASAKSTAKAFTVEIGELDAERAAKIAETEFPIDGLAVGAGGVTYMGVPFAQASSAEQLRVSVAMGFAVNPKLRVLLIRDGSLLDEDNLEALALQAEEAGAQVWLERVGDGEECSVVIEDGQVKEGKT